MSWKTIVACLLCLLIGFFVRGAFVADHDRVEGDPTSEKRKASRRGHGSSESSEDQRSVRRRPSGGGVEAAELEVASGLPRPDEGGALVTVPSSLLEKLAAKNKNQSLQNELFSPGGELEAILQISDREKANLQQAWVKTRNRLRQLEVGKSKSETLPDGSVKITLPDVSTDVVGIGDEFFGILADQLGDNRAEAFASIRQLNSAFKRPEGETTYTVKVEAIGDGRWRYQMSQKGPSGNKMWIGENIPSSIRHLTDAANIRSHLNPPDEEDYEE